MALKIDAKEALEHPTRALARLAVETSFEDLPAPVVHEAKRAILDFIGIALAGCTADIGAMAVGYARALGGKPECTIIGYGDKTSSLAAAYCNGRSGDAIDATDYLMNSAHIGCPLCASALALSEREGLSGRDLIAAVAVGFEVGARVMIGTSLPPAKPVGAALPEAMGRRQKLPIMEMASAAAAGRAMKLEEAQIVNALGIAGTNAPLRASRFGDHFPLPYIKHADVGDEAAIGVNGALRAQHGQTAHPGILDGGGGLWKIRGSGYCDFEAMVEGLGKKWYLPRNSYKPWPSCRYTHHPLTTFLKILGDNGIKPEDIEHVLVRIEKRGAGPRFDRKDPVGTVTCEFNTPYVLAVAALGFPRGPMWYARRTMNDPRVRTLIRKVDVEQQDDWPGCETWSREDQLLKVPNRVIVTAKGKKFEGYGEYAGGDPFIKETFMSDEELKAKFADMAIWPNIGSSKWADRVDKLADMVWQLEKLGDVSELTKLLAR
ncbi:MAG: MmgE/PrpD family protein [Chloroflexi bacterium]|nr:MmgE/PrpD family protein [Chloroflexota bacterium]